MNKIIGVELSHEHAPISVRELAALNKQQIIRTLRSTKKDFDEAFIIATCNRLAFYGIGNSIEPIIAIFKRLGISRRYLNILPDTEIAVRNLFKTAAGLNSQAIGEHQILGQIKTAFGYATEAGTDGPITNQLVGHAIHTGKRVRKETNIGKYSTSLATVGFELIKKHGYELPESTMLVIGTGNMANLVATILDRTKIKKLYVASHYEDRAKQMASEWRGEAITMQGIHKVLTQVDIIIGGTQGEVNLLSEKELESSKCTRAQLGYDTSAQKLLIDFGVPRNFNEDLKTLSNVHLYDLDDIKEITFEGLKKRYDEIPQANEIVEDEMEHFTKWITDRFAAPMIESYWNQLDGIKEEELSWLLPKLGDLSDDQQALLERFAHRMIRRFTNPPIQALKKMVEDPDSEKERLKAARELLDLKGYPVSLPNKTVIVGTRGSKLALTQTTQVLEALQAKNPDVQFQLKIVKTPGDAGNIQELGAFTNAIQRKLITGEVDLAVHSYKDLPTEGVAGLKIGAVTEREDVRDVLISNDNLTFDALPQGAVVGTGSPRRRFQLLKVRPDLEVKHIQGNVDSRMKKMEAGEYDAIILAAAGLNRIDMIEVASDVFTTEQMLPAAGQGCLALEIREDDHELADILKSVHNDSAATCIDAERKLLELMGGGCNLPVGCHAEISGDMLKLNAFYALDENTSHITSKTGKLSEWEDVVIQVANELKEAVADKKKVPVSEGANK